MHEIDGVGSLDIDKDNPEKVNELSLDFSSLLPNAKHFKQKLRFKVIKTNTKQKH